MRAGLGEADGLFTRIPEWATRILHMAGQVLMAAAIGRLLYMLGGKRLFPYFLAGFVFWIYGRALLSFEITTLRPAYEGMGEIVAGYAEEYTYPVTRLVPPMAMALLGLFLAFLHGTIVLQRSKKNIDHIEVGTPQEAVKGRLTSKDLGRVWLRWWFFCEQSWSYARWKGLAVGLAYLPILKQLYEDEDAYFRALQRHTEPFESEGAFGALALGVVLAMEERHAAGADMPVEAIQGVKAGLMRPTHTLGYQLNDMILYPLLFTVLCERAIYMGLSGILIFVILYAVLILLEGYLFIQAGYLHGGKILDYLKASPLLQAFTKGAAVFGLFMLGFCGANWVNITTPLAFTQSGSAFSIQKDIFDAILPGILSLAPILFTYWRLCKGRSFGKIMLLLFCMVIVLGALGIVGDGGMFAEAVTTVQKKQSSWYW
jgi:mannose/fructose/N-acetylgalactosamine-specific phosphotransferase system component IID